MAQDKYGLGRAGRKRILEQKKETEFPTKRERAMMQNPMKMRSEGKKHMIERRPLFYHGPLIRTRTRKSPTGGVM